MTPQLIHPLNIAVVGDVHEQWEWEDNRTLLQLGVDLVLFVGDFGNEAVEVVRKIAALDLPKAAIFGNHDAYYSACDRGRKKAPYDHRREDRVQQQLDLLGDTHVGFARLDFPQFPLAVVGARPFSWGGSHWRNRRFYQERFNISGFEASTARIIAAAQASPYQTLIFLAHNGPYGLGDRPEDSCGKDWRPVGGDFGDPDLTAAIAAVKAQGKIVPLVAFGHMHHQLRHSKTQLRRAVNCDPDNTLYLNAASVPRLIQQGSQRWRNFSLVTLDGQGVVRASLIWVAPDYTIAAQTDFYQRPTYPSSWAENPRTAV